MSGGLVRFGRRREEQGHGWVIIFNDGRGAIERDVGITCCRQEEQDMEGNVMSKCQCGDGKERRRRKNEGTDLSEKTVSRRAVGTSRRKL